MSDAKANIINPINTMKPTAVKSFSTLSDTGLPIIISTTIITICIPSRPGIGNKFEKQRAIEIIELKNKMFLSFDITE